MVRSSARRPPAKGEAQSRRQTARGDWSLVWCVAASLQRCTLSGACSAGLTISWRRPCKSRQDLRSRENRVSRPGRLVRGRWHDPPSYSVRRLGHHGCGRCRARFTLSSCCACSAATACCSRPCCGLRDPRPLRTAARSSPTRSIASSSPSNCARSGRRRARCCSSRSAATPRPRPASRRWRLSRATPIR